MSATTLRHDAALAALKIRDEALVASDTAITSTITNLEAATQQAHTELTLAVEAADRKSVV